MFAREIVILKPVEIIANEKRDSLFTGKMQTKLSPHGQALGCAFTCTFLVSQMTYIFNREIPLTIKPTNRLAKQ